LSIRDNWRRTQALAKRTPVRRNRSVDFLRAASICVVVIGHWLMAAAYLADGRLRIGDMLEFAPWTQWLTWAFQVMPLFFMVGGYANGVSWQSATRKGIGYHLWLSARLQRLLGPVVPLLLVWVLIAAAGSHAGIKPELIRVGSQASFTPTWFLAVYIMVVVTTPLTWRAWRRFGPSSFAVLALCAAAVDTLSFILDLPLLRWINYAFVWLAVHQLGYLWRDRRILGPGQALLWAIGGFAALVLLVTLAMICLVGLSELATGKDEYAEKARYCFRQFIDHNLDPRGIKPKFTDTRPTRNIGFPLITINTAQELRHSVQLDEADEWIDRSINDIRQHASYGPMFSSISGIGWDWINGLFLAGGGTVEMEVGADSYRSLGEPDAPVVVTEFADFQ